MSEFIIIMSFGFFAFVLLRALAWNEPLSKKHSDEYCKAIIDQIVNEEGVKFNEYHVNSTNYSIWITNRSYGFQINGDSGFTLKQRYMFYHALDQAILEGKFKKGR